MHPSAMKRLFPDLDESDWPTYGAVEKDTVYLPNAKRAVPLQPTPPPFRNHGNHVTSVAQLGRFLRQQAEEAGVYILRETAGHKLLVDDGEVVGVRTGDKGRGRDGQELRQLRARLGPDRQGHRARRGHAGPPDRRGDQSLRPRLRRPAAVGARRQGGLGGPEAARPRDPHDGLAAPASARSTASSAARSSTRWARTRCRSASSSGSTTRTRRFSVHDVLQEFKTHPMIGQDPRGRQARRLGREDDSVRRLLGACRSGCGRPAW